VTAVLDASAVLALLFNEPGADTVAEHIAAGATMSTVNLSEVATILIRHGRDPDTVLDPLQAQVDILAFTDSDAIATASSTPWSPPRDCPSATAPASPWPDDSTHPPTLSRPAGYRPATAGRRVGRFQGRAAGA